MDIYLNCFQASKSSLFLERFRKSCIDIIGSISTLLTACVAFLLNFMASRLHNISFNSPQLLKIIWKAKGVR